MEGKSILEVLSVFTFAYLMRWVFSLTVVGVEPWWKYFVQTISVLIPVSILLLTKRSFESYGFTLKRWRYNLNVAMTFVLFVLIIVGILGWVPIFMFHLGTDKEMTGSVILAATHSVALFLSLQKLRNREGATPVIVAPLLFPFTFMGFSLSGFIDPYRLVDTLIYYPLFNGFGEEIYFRGYFQSRMNQEFGRPFKFLGVNFGLGLLLTSLLFGFSHVLAPFDPFAGYFNLSWWWGFWTFFSGLLFGLVREKTGSIIAAGVTHGLPNATWILFAQLFSLPTS